MVFTTIAARLRGLNYNIKIGFIYTLFASTGRGIWLGNLLSLYIVSLFESGGNVSRFLPNQLVGISSGLMGFATILVVFPAGFCADRFGRDRVLKLASIIGLVGIACLIKAEAMPLLCVALVIWGLFEGLGKPALDALIADSVPSGERSRFYCSIHAVDQFGMSLGPFLNVLLFLMFGDRWDLAILKKVMIVGNITSLAAVSLLFFFKDSRGIGHASEAIPVAAPENDTATEDQAEEKTRPFVSRRFVPYFLMGANFIISIGAGMTIKFFPIFFKSIYHLSPVALQILMGMTAVCTGLLSLIAQRLSQRNGRIQTMISVQIIAIACLFLLAFYPPLWIMVLLFIVRSAFMNAAQPLSNSIVMDYIPKKHRGKWNSANTIAWGLFWNLSAIAGGFLIGQDNFRLCFIVTGTIYVVGMIPLFLIIPQVSHEYSLRLDSSKKILSPISASNKN